MKFLALEKQLPSVTENDVQPHLKAEALRVWELVQQGVIREIYFRGDVRSAVVMLECASQSEAEKAMETLPLVREELISFEIVPLIPYPGFSRLFAASE